MKWTKFENPFEKLRPFWSKQPALTRAFLLATLVFACGWLVYAISSGANSTGAPPAWNDEESTPQAKRAMAMSMRSLPANTEADSAAEVGGAADEAMADSGEEIESTPETNVAPAPANGSPTGAMSKKIIQNFEVNLRVKDIDVAAKQLTEMVTAAGGYISHSEKSGGPGTPRSGSWVCRIPDTKSSGVATELAGIGEVIQQSMSATDVSEEFYDVEARLKNKKVEEERLVKHLRDSTGKLADILAVERELERVRGEIEQVQGRLNYLSNQTSMATIRVSMEEFVGQRPQTPIGFGSRIAMTFIESLGGIKYTATGMVLGVVAMIPWLAIFAALTGVIYGLLRMRKNQ